MNFRIFASDQRLSLLFTKTHSALYQRLSLNVVREVCFYLASVFLPAVQRHDCAKVVLHNLTAGTQISISLSEELPRGASYCAIDSLTLFSVGNDESDRSAKRIDLITGTVSVESPMDEARSAPGVICFHSRVYVFGGYCIDNELKSCEAFSLMTKEWTQCPDMLSPKLMFTPVEHRREIYLAAPKPIEEQLEVFTPATLQYRLLLLRLQQFDYGSVSFISEEELVVVASAKEIFTWRLGSEQVEASTIGEFHNSNCGFSSGSLIHFGNCVYWPDMDGNLVRFDVISKVLFEPNITNKS